jgi:transposase
MKIIINLQTMLHTFILNDPNVRKFYLKSFSHTKYSLNNILTAILYVLKTGIAWRDLMFPIHWQSVFFHFRRLCKYSVFNKFFYFLRNNYLATRSPGVQLVDSSFILNKTGREHIARNKFFKSKNCNKLSLITDADGTPLSVFCGLGNLHDLNITDFHFNDLFVICGKHKSVTLLADKGYISKQFTDKLKNCNYTLMVPHKSNMKPFENFDAHLYKQRIHVEHTFSKLKQFKRIQLRYDSSLSAYDSFVFLACSILILRKLC